MGHMLYPADRIIQVEQMRPSTTMDLSRAEVNSSDLQAGSETTGIKVFNPVE